MMKVVDLMKEDGSNESVRLTVTSKDYKVLKSLEYIGGFKRFGIALYDDVHKGIRQKDELLNFLSGVFVNTELVESYF